MGSPLTGLPSPCFVLDDSLLRKNSEILEEIQKRAGVSILLALKGFSLWASFPLVKPYLKGAAVSSLNEAKLGEETFKESIHTYAVGYHPAEIEQLFFLSSYFTFNSWEAYKRHHTLKTASSPSLGIRVNPLYSNISHPTSNPASPYSRLGILPNEIPEEWPDDLEGIHVHTLSEGTATDLEELLKAIESCLGNRLSSLKWINLGGGHLLTGASYDRSKAINLLKQFQERYEVHLFMELSTAIAWHAGYLQCTVLDILPRSPQPIAVVDISFPTHLQERWKHFQNTSIKGGKREAKGGHTYVIGGCSCMADDCLGAYTFDEKLSVGQTLIIENAVHYSLEKSSHFNGIRHPALAIRRENDQIDVVRRFGFLDYKNNLS